MEKVKKAFLQREVEGTALRESGTQKPTLYLTMMLGPLERVKVFSLSQSVLHESGFGQKNILYYLLMEF